MAKQLLEEQLPGIPKGVYVRELSNDWLNWAVSFVSPSETLQEINLSPSSEAGGRLLVDRLEPSLELWPYWSSVEHWKQTAPKTVVYKLAFCLNLLVAAVIVLLVVGPYEWWRRRRWAFSLRSLLIGLTLLAVCLAWGRSLVSERNRELAHVAKFEAMELVALYDCEAPHWLVRLVGLERMSYFFRVSTIGNNDAESGDDEVTDYEEELEMLFYYMDQEDQEYFSSEVQRVLEETKGRYVDGLDKEAALYRDRLQRIQRIQRLADSDDVNWSEIEEEEKPMIEQWKAELVAKRSEQLNHLRSITSQLDSLKSLFIDVGYYDGIKQLEGARGFSELRVDRWKDSSQLLKSLATLSQLEKLSLENVSEESSPWGPESWAHLRSLPNLRVLNIRQPISDRDLAKIAKISTLEELTVTANISAETMLMFGDLKQLKRLSLTFVWIEEGSTGIIATGTLALYEDDPILEILEKRSLQDDTEEVRLIKDALEKLCQMRPDIEIDISNHHRTVGNEGELP